MNDGFERNDKVRKTMKRHPNNPTEGGWLLNQDGLVRLEKEEAELTAMGGNEMLRENAEISASPWRWGWQTCAERRK